VTEPKSRRPIPCEQVALAQKLTTEQQLQEQVASVLARHREQMLDVEMTEAQVMLWLAWPPRMVKFM
jgi:hypothetical protein